MKIAFDAKRITHNATGLGNYSRYIVNALLTHYPALLAELYTPSLGSEQLRSRLIDTNRIMYKYPTRTIYAFFQSAWRSFGLLRELKRSAPALFHGLSNELPFTLKKNGIKSVVTIHDLIFLRYPAYYNRLDRLIYYWKFKRACLQADQIVAVSECTKRDIVSFFNIDPAKIEVVYQGCDHSFCTPATPHQKELVKTKYSLPNRYLLTVGSIESRKNQLLLVKALAHCEEKIHLIMIGKKTPYVDLIQQYIVENQIESQVSILHQVPFSELPALYQQASLFIYPSFFEGFGIPIVEALHSGVPVIAATGSCLEEAGGAFSCYVNPTDEVALGEIIEQLLANPERRQNMIAEGKIHAQQFDDRLIAKNTMAVYEKVLGEKPISANEV